MNTCTTSPRQRNIAVALATALCGVSLLSGCSADVDADGTPGPGWIPMPEASGTATPGPAPVPDLAAAASEVPADEAFDPAKVLAATGDAPYAATLRMISEMNGVSSQTMSGRGNFNGPFTGRMKMNPGEFTTEVIMTDDTTYVRVADGAGAEWKGVPRSGTDSPASYEGYAKLLLDAGPSARRGMEEQDGIATYHLSGRLGLAQIASVDPRIHTSMKAKGVTGFDVDQWIDDQGRTIRFEQRFELRGVQVANKATFGDFGPAEKFAAPTNG